MRDMKPDCYTGIRPVASAPCIAGSPDHASQGRPTMHHRVARPCITGSPDHASQGCPSRRRVPAGAWAGVTAEIKIARRAYISKFPLPYPAGNTQQGNYWHSQFSIHNLIGGKTLISQSSLSGNEEAFQSPLFPYSICINKGIRDVCVRVFGLLRGLFKIRAMDDETSEVPYPTTQWIQQGCGHSHFSNLH